MDKLITHLNSQYIELCEMPEGDVAGRLKIKMSALCIHPDTTQHNDNGITWLEQYVEDNKQSAIGMPYVVSWLDEENQIPSDHGTMSYDDEGNAVFEGVTVGSVQDVYIEDVEINGETKRLLMTEGFLYGQRYPLFIKWLKNELKNGVVYGSIEINGKGKSKTIVYRDGSKNDDGTMKVGRIPTVFDFSGLAILYLTEPADKNSIIFEVNSKQEKGEKMEIIAKGTAIEINKLSYDDIMALVIRAIDKAMGGSGYCGDYYPIRFYPDTSEVVFYKYGEVGKYYMTTYKIENTIVTLGDIIRVEEDWKPVSSAQSVEVNIEKIKERIKKEGGQDQMTIEELNAKIAELSEQIVGLNSTIAELNAKVVEKDNQITEINGLLVEANKSLEAEKAKCTALETECNTYKAEKAQAEAVQKQAEVNAYFETEIPKNNFDEAEVNSLKEFVTKCDLEGLKNAEAALIVKKFKEGKLGTVETNDKKDNTDLFFSTREEKIDDIEAGKALFN